MATGSLALGTLVAALLAPHVWAQTVQNAWVLPEFPDFTTTFHQGEQVTLQWSSGLQDTFAQYCAPCDISNVDLWVVGGSDDKYQFQVTSAIDVSTTLTFDWQVLIPDNDLQAQQVWALRFIPSGTLPHGAGDGAEVSSPQFQIVAAVAPSSTTTTSAPTGTSSAASTATTSAAPSASGGGLSTGAAAGIGVGIGVVALLIIALLALWLVRRRKNAKNNDAIPELQQGPPAELQQAPTPFAGTANSGYFEQDYKSPAQSNSAASPAPPYIPPLNEAAHTEQPPKPAELNANVDPVELPGEYYQPR